MLLVLTMLVWTSIICLSSIRLVFITSDCFFVIFALAGILIYSDITFK